MTNRNLAGQRLGEFVLREQIAEGGGGAVYRSAQPRLNRDVIVKVLRDRRRDQNGAQARFEREAQLASRLDHPYAVHVYAFGSDRELLWIAMELVPGVTLDEWLKVHGPMPLELFAPFFEGLADVVHCMHERGIVHRDLKPSNVMVVENGGRLIPKLIDLGIAKVDQDLAPLSAWPEGSLSENGKRSEITRTDPAAKNWSLTPAGIGIGSSPYMSPEQWDNASAVGPASDIYSLGILAYKALTGRLPFTGATTGEYYLHHLQSPVPPVGDELPRSLDGVFGRALAKRPDARPANAIALAGEICAALRASERALLRSRAEQWDAQARPPGLLLQGDLLTDVERWTRRVRPDLTPLECSFVASSQRSARGAARARRAAIVLAAAAVIGTSLGVLQYRAAMRTQLAEEQASAARQVTEATIVQSEIEQGRSALLHGEPEALAHLAEAYRRGDHSPSTSFMLARAIQPRLQEKARLPSSFGRMWSAAFSPDGKQIVTTDDRGAQLWDAGSYQRQFQLPHDSTVYSAGYSADGSRLATISQNAVRLWDPHKGTLIRQLPRPRNTVDYYLGAISQDGRLVAAVEVGGDYTDVWDAETGKSLTTIKNDAAGFPDLSFSTDGRWLATGNGNDVHVLDTKSWHEITHIAGPHIHRLAFDPAGTRLVTGSNTGDTSVWEIPSGRRLQHLHELGEPIDAVAFSPNGELIVIGSRNGAAQVWDAASGRLVSQIEARHAKPHVVQFDATSTRILVAAFDGSVVIADADSGIVVAVFEGARGLMRTAHFDPNAENVIAASWDGTARIWEARATYRRWSSAPVQDNCGIVSNHEPDRRIVAVSCGARTIVWDTATGTRLNELPGVSDIEGDVSSPFPVTSADGIQVAIARGSKIEVYDVRSGKVVRVISQGAPVTTVSFASTGRDIISGGADGSAIVTRDDRVLLGLPRSTAAIDVVAFLPNGDLVEVDASRQLRVFDRGGADVEMLVLPSRVAALRTHGRRLLALPSYDGKPSSTIVIDVDRRGVTTQLDGHIGKVYSGRWLDDRRVLTSGADGMVRVFDSATGQPLQTYHGGFRFISDATMSSDGAQMIAGDAEGVLWFWDTQSGAKLWTLQAHKSPLIGLHIEGTEIVTRGFAGELSRWAFPSTERVIAACNHHEPCANKPK